MGFMLEVFYKLRVGLKKFKEILGSFGKKIKKRKNFEKKNN